MQCHQPLFGCGFPTPGPYHPVNPCSSTTPDIIGEGEVTAISFPDGTTQYYFLPLRWQSDFYTRRWPPYPFNDCSFYNPNRSGSGVWIITKISNTVSPVFNQYWQRPNLDPFTKPCFNYDCNVNLPQFQLKFHNDCCTSTTDLQYFCLPVSRRPLVTPCSASVQVDTIKDFNQTCPNEDCTNNTNTNELNNKNNVECRCRKLDKKRSSKMSIDKSRKTSSSSLEKSKKKSKESSSSQSLKKSKKNKQKQKKSCSTSSSCLDSRKSRKKRTKVICECDLPSSATEGEIANTNKKQTAKQKSKVNRNGVDDGKKLSKETKNKVHCYCDVKGIEDKAVVTYNDQASSVKEVEGQTQTGKCSNCTYPSPPLPTNVQVISRNLSVLNQSKAPQSSEKLIGVYEISSSESNNSICSCASKTSQESAK